MVASSRFHRDNAVISCPGTGNWLHVRGGGTPVHSVRLPFALPRETAPSCVDQFLTVAKLMATSRENYVSAPRSTPAADERVN